MNDTLQRVQEIIAESLYVEKEECLSDANLMSDLGAESIDFLDIVFRIEREFGVKIPRGEIEARSRGSLTEEEFATDGVISQIGLDNLKRVMPEADDALIVPGLMVRDIPSLFTVATFARIVDEKIGSQDRRDDTVAAPRRAAMSPQSASAVSAG